MGTVYEGFDPAIGRRVAIKTLRTEMFEPRQLPDVLVRFKREAQSAGRLSHPHIVTIHEFGEEQGTPYVVMEYMSGTELGHRLESGSRFTLDEVMRIMTQLLGRSRTRTAWCTAISSQPTCSCSTTARSRSWTSASRESSRYAGLMSRTLGK